MALVLPVPSLDWQWAVTRAVAAEATAAAQAAEVALNVIDALTTFPLFPFTVEGSSDSVTAGMDAVNRLIDAADIVASAGAHSWIVLENPVTGYQTCIDWNSVTGKWVTTRVYSAAAGFTGGSTTARPTATDESVIESAGAWNPSNAGGRTQVHVLHSENGEVTNVFTMYRGFLTQMWLMGSAGDPVTGWTSPYYVSMDGVSTLGTGYLLDFLHGTSSTIKARAPAGNMTLQWTALGCGGATIGHLHDHFGYTENAEDGRFIMSDLGLVSRTASCRGRHGKMVDLWRCAAGLPSGTIFRDAGRQFGVLGGLVVPWPADTQVRVG